MNGSFCGADNFFKQPITFESVNADYRAEESNESLDKFKAEYLRNEKKCPRVCSLKLGSKTSKYLLQRTPLWTAISSFVAPKIAESNT